MQHHGMPHQRAARSRGGDVAAGGEHHRSRSGITRRTLTLASNRRSNGAAWSARVLAARWRSRTPSQNALAPAAFEPIKHPSQRKAIGFQRSATARAGRDGRRCRWRRSKPGHCVGRHHIPGQLNWVVVVWPVRRFRSHAFRPWHWCCHRFKPLSSRTWRQWLNVSRSSGNGVEQGRPRSTRWLALSCSLY